MVCNFALAKSQKLLNFKYQNMNIYFAVVLVEVIIFFFLIRALVRHLDRKDEKRANEGARH